jgi:hypothetical protein
LSSRINRFKYHLKFQKRLKINVVITSGHYIGNAPNDTDNYHHTNYRESFLLMFLDFVFTKRRAIHHDSYYNASPLDPLNVGLHKLYR